MRIRTFKTKKSKKFFFSFLADNGDVIIKSIPFDSKEERDLAKRSTLKDFSNNKNILTFREGADFFIKSDYKGKTILNSEAYNNANTRDTAAKMLHELSAKLLQEEIEAEDQIEKNTNAYKTDGKNDDYKPLGFYEKNKGNVKAGFSSFFDEASSEHYFSFLSKGQVLLLSEGYKTDKSRDNGINSVKKNMPLAQRYDRQQHQNGKYFFNLKAGNNQEIATSRWFDSEDAMNDTISDLLSGGVVTSLSSSADEKTSNDISAKAKTNDVKENLGLIGVGANKSENENKKNKKKPKKDKGKKVIIKDGKYAVNDLVWQIFQSGGNQKYYYIIRDTNNKSVYFNSNVQGFETIEQAENGLMHSMKFSPNESNFEKKVAKNGKHYFYILDNEKKQVGKSFFYGTEDDMKAAMSLLFHGGSSPTVSKGIETKKTGGQDEYLVCAAYAGADGFHKFSAEGEEYFAYNQNGKTYLRSEGYSSSAGRDNGIKSVIKNAPNDDRWKMGKDDEGHYYLLKAGNSQEIARSCPYASEAEMQKALDWVRGEESILGKGAKEVDGAWVSASAFGLIAANNLKAENDAKAKVEAEARLKAEANAKAEEEARLKKEAEAKDKAEEEVRLKKEAEAKAKAEEEARLKKETEAKAKAEEEARLKKEAEAKAKEEEAAALKFKKEKELEAAKIVSLASTPKKDQDEYLPCASYAGQKGFNSFEKEGYFYFSYINEDGEVLLRSQAYKSAGGRDNGIESVKKNSKIKERWFEVEEKGQHFYILKAGNKQEIARSCGTSNKAAMNALFAAAAFTPWAAKKVISKSTPVEKKPVQAKKPVKIVSKEPKPVKKVVKAKPVAPLKKEAAVVHKASGKKAAVGAVGQDAGAAGCFKKWWWLLLLAALLALIFFLFKTCGGDTIGTTADLTPPIKEKIVAPVEEKKEEKAIEAKEEAKTKKDATPAKQALCPNVSSSALNLRAQTTAGKMADYLSNPESTYPKKFAMDYANFEYNEARMTQSGKDEIPRFAKVLRACKNCKVKIYGHIDASETDQYNGEYQDGSGISLSAIRARCAYKRLIDAGVPASKLEFVGSGKQSPLVASDSDANKRKNRRVELELFKK